MATAIWSNQLVGIHDAGLYNRQVHTGEAGHRTQSTQRCPSNNLFSGSMAALSLWRSSRHRLNDVFPCRAVEFNHNDRSVKASLRMVSNQSDFRDASNSNHQLYCFAAN